MDVKKVADLIESYLVIEADIDELGDHYAAKGVYDGSERLEVGTFVDELEPLVQIELEPEPRIDKRDSYLDSDGFTGCAYSLTKEEFDDIKSSLK